MKRVDSRGALQVVGAIVAADCDADRGQQDGAHREEEGKYFDLLVAHELLLLAWAAERVNFVEFSGIVGVQSPASYIAILLLRRACPLLGIALLAHLKSLEEADFIREILPGARRLCLLTRRNR